MTKTRMTTLATALTAATAAAGLLVGPAATGAKQLSCKHGKEQQGCVLKKGQRYSGATANGPRSTLKITTQRKAIKLSFEGMVQCDQGGDPVGVQVRIAPPVPGKPKLGRSYDADVSERIGTNDEGVETNALTGKVKLKSAKTAVARLTYTYTSGPRVGCTSTVRIVLKRVLGS
jgi:hypothetical protein